MEQPFRKMPGLLGALRSTIRSARLLKIHARLRGRIKLGHTVTFAKNATLNPPGYIHIGNFVSVGKDFTCETNLIVGNEVLISGNVSIIGDDHLFDDPATTVYWQGRTEGQTVRIGNDVLIGFGSIILGNVKIGDGCIVGAGSLVTGDLPPNSICVGRPAKMIRARHSKISSSRSALTSHEPESEIGS